MSAYYKLIRCIEELEAACEAACDRFTLWCSALQAVGIYNGDLDPLIDALTTTIARAKEAGR